LLHEQPVSLIAVQLNRLLPSTGIIAGVFYIYAAALAEDFVDGCHCLIQCFSFSTSDCLFPFVLFVMENPASSSSIPDSTFILRTLKSVSRRTVIAAFNVGQGLLLDISFSHNSRFGLFQGANIRCAVGLDH
jgi:hypothetical protein